MAQKVQDTWYMVPHPDKLLFIPAHGNNWMQATNVTPISSQERQLLLFYLQNGTYILRMHSQESDF